MENKEVEYIFLCYCEHFKKKGHPATFNDLIKYAKILGLKEKHPTKTDLVKFFLNRNIIF
jgi:hypothetical protein